MTRKYFFFKFVLFAFIGSMYIMLHTACQEKVEIIPINTNDSLSVLEILKANNISWDRYKYIKRINNDGYVVQLEIRSRYLKNIPSKIGNLVYLEYLDISDNEILTLPKEFEKLTNLTTFIAENNQIQKLPDGFRNAKLVKVYLSSNRISALPTNIDVTTIRELDLSSNKIRFLPPDFKYLSNLLSFNINNNYLDSLPVEIADMKILKRLDVSYNNLTQIPLAFSSLTLDYLNLDYNKLCVPFPALNVDENAKIKTWMDNYDRDWSESQSCN